MSGTEPTDTKPSYLCWAIALQSLFFATYLVIEFFLENGVRLSESELLYSSILLFANAMAILLTRQTMPGIFKLMLKKRRLKLEKEIGDLQKD